MTNQEIKLRLIESFIRGGRMRQVDDLSDIPSKVDKLLEYINKDIVNNESEEEQLKKIYFDFYDQMEEPERSEAKANFTNESANNELKPLTIMEAIFRGFFWKETKQNYEYWNNINNKYDK